MAPMSSTTARATSSTLSPMGQRFPKRERTPIAKAMSVAIGIPHPLAEGVPLLNSIYITAGKIIPPSAANIGSIAFFMVDSSPTRSSLLISSPTEKKNTAIRTSSIHPLSGILSEEPPNDIPRSLLQNSCSPLSAGTLAASTAISAHTRSSTPPVMSLLRIRSSTTRRRRTYMFLCIIVCQIIAVYKSNYFFLREYSEYSKSLKRILAPALASHSPVAPGATSQRSRPTIRRPDTASM